MAPPEVHHLFHNPIVDHSFSADHQTLAVARESNVELYTRSGNSFQLQDELRGHDKTVTGVDIAPNTGKIVTCSQGTITSPHSLYSLFRAADYPRRPQRLCLGAFSLRLEAHARAPPPQPRRNLRPLE